jgi:hypothetical protein
MLILLFLLQLQLQWRLLLPLLWMPMRVWLLQQLLIRKR